MLTKELDNQSFIEACHRNITTIMQHYNYSYNLIHSDFTIYVAANAYITPVWILLGIPGAILSIAVWSNRKMRNSSSMYLIALSAVDASFFIAQLLFYLYNIKHIGLLNILIICQLVPILNSWTMYLSPLLTFGFTVERYISICHPFQREQYCTIRRACIVITSLVLWTFAIASIQGNFYEIQNGVCKEPKALYNQSTLLSRFWHGWTWTTEMLHYGLVPLAILTCNVLVIKETRRIFHRNSAVGIANQELLRNRNSVTTLMLLTVSFYQILTTLPATVCYVVFFFMLPKNDCLTVGEALNEPSWKSYFAFLNVKAIVEMFSMSHYAIRLYLYIGTGTTFRNQFLRMFCACLPHSFISVQENTSYLKLYPPVSRNQRQQKLKTYLPIKDVCSEIMTSPARDSCLVIQNEIVQSYC